MPKISKNGILNIFELFFLDDINNYVNIGIADTQMECQNCIYFRCNSPIFIEYGDLCKNNFDIIMDTPQK